MSKPELPVAPDPPPKQASLRQVAGAVFWSFFGVRKGAAMSRDIGTIKPAYVIVVGIAIAAALVLGLVALTQFLTRGL